MTCYAEPSVPDGFRWRYRRTVSGNRCSGARSIRHGSWFHNCHLTLQEVLYLTYEILRRELPYTSNMNITSLSTRSPTGVCFAERLS
jgi:hypothetical protein